MTLPSDDLDLEPLDPATLNAAPTNSASTPRQSRARRRDRRAMRLYALAAVLAVFSLAGGLAALHAWRVDSDLRALERVWRTCAVIDRDRSEAVRAVDATAQQFGDSPRLREQRDSLFDAEQGRLDKLSDDLRRARLTTATARRLRASMLAAIRVRDEQLGRELVPEDDRTFKSVAAELDRTLRRWWLAPRQPRGVALTAAREAIERMDRFADAPTGLVLVAATTDRLLVIDVDASRVSERLVIADDAAIATHDDLVLVRTGDTVRALSRQTLGAPSSPPDWERISAATPRPVLDALNARAATRESRTDVRRGWVVALVDGRVLLGRAEPGSWDPVVLRAPLPPLRDVLIVP